MPIPFLSANMPLTSGQVLKQRYRILSKLGEGGFATVYLAADQQMQDELQALKEVRLSQLPPRQISQVLASFRQEAAMSSQCPIRGIPRVHTLFQEGDRWYLVMEYIAGETLEEKLAHAPHGKLPAQQVLGWALQLCEILAFLHGHHPPIIFRDVKPANVIITPDDTLYLVDFGIARSFKTGQGKDTIPLGSPGYAAPEQYGRAQSTPVTDVYGLGATLHHLLSGHDPSERLFQFFPLHLKDEAPIGPPLAAIIEGMVQQRSEQRPTLLEVQNGLQELQRRQKEASIPQRETGKTLLTFQCLHESIGELVWHPDSQHLLLRGYGRDVSPFRNEVQCWDTKTGKMMWACPSTYYEDLSLHKQALTLSPDGNRLVFIQSDGWTIYSIDGNIIFSSCSLGKLSLFHSENRLCAVDWSPDGTYLAFISEVRGKDGRTILLWNVALQRIDATLCIKRAYKGCLSWSPNGKYLAVLKGGDGIVLGVVKEATLFGSKLVLQKQYSFFSPKGEKLAWSPNGKYLAVFDRHLGIDIIEVFIGTSRYIPCEREPWYISFSWSPDSRYIAVGDAYGSVSIWEAGEKALCVFKERKHSHSVDALAWSPDGKSLASVSRYGLVEIWQAPS
jgi:WD40 repeat protein